MNSKTLILLILTTLSLPPAPGNEIVENIDV
jgi:hypothetical protein